ncbi:MAG: uncharacterized protein JWR80_6060 [Bradyrhizobium sp.]|nr:uncharacterized protein [Bradyrhizobium sp.]
MSDPAQPTFGIVGGGFTGTMLAVHLIEQSPVPVRILLFDRAAAFGSGVAYSTPNDKHLLNVRVGNMSAYDSRPEHFIKWLEGCAQAPGAEARGPFVSRGLYGQYLRSTLTDCLAAHPASSMIGVDAEVTSLRTGEKSVEVETSDGARHSVDRVALCVGNFPPALPVKPKTGAAGEAHYIANPWSGGLSRIGKDDSVVLVGTGLTMVDVVLDLHSRGHRGTITAVSRRGFLPLPHQDVSAYPAFLAPHSLPTTVTALMRTVRREVSSAAASGVDWRAVLDSMRPQTQALWRGLSIAERRRFLRHVRPYWEVHRHRVAQPVAAEIEALRRSEKLVVLAGRLQSVELGEKGVSVAVKARSDKALHRIDGTWLVNCSGPQLDYDRIEDPLIRSLFDAGLARPDALSLGLDLGDDYRLMSRDGVASDVLFALGPPIRGNLWETTAVPDIRKQCDAVARHLTSTVA